MRFILKVRLQRCQSLCGENAPHIGINSTTVGLAEIGAGHHGQPAGIFHAGRHSIGGKCVDFDALMVYFPYTMFQLFQFDPRKSRANDDKHGIDFTQAQALWDDADLVEIPAKTVDEPRFLPIGTIDGRHWSAVAPPRDREAVTFASYRFAVRAQKR